MTTYWPLPVSRPDYDHYVKHTKTSQYCPYKDFEVHCEDSIGHKIDRFSSFDAAFIIWLRFILDPILNL
jgi:hypothetical protein